MRTATRPWSPPAGHDNGHQRASDWRDLASCRGMDVNEFYALDDNTAAEAALVCMQCPVRRPCLDAALAKPERFGVWGGQTSGQRGYDKTGTRRRR